MCSSDLMVDKIKQIGKEMLSGRISAKPYKLKGKDGCMYCKYHTICQFDTATKDNDYERLDTLRDKQIWETLCPHQEEGR